MENLTMAEAAKFLRINYCTLSRKAKEGEIPCFKFGGKVLFRRTALNEWIMKQELSKGAANND